LHEKHLHYIRKLFQEQVFLII